MASFTPSIRVKEGKNTYRVELPTPGIKKEDFNIYTEGNKLIISCKNKINDETRKKLVDFWQKANDDSYFFKFFALPENADSERITAKYNGVLSLCIPKKKKKNKRKQ